jgi:hypothetical protein
VKRSLHALQVSAVLLAGCGVTLSQSDWRGPAGSNWAKDSYECERDARLSVGSGGRETFREVRSLTEQCMVAGGYSKAPAQPSGHDASERLHLVPIRGQTKITHIVSSARWAPDRLT